MAFPERHRRAQHRLLAPQTLTKALCLQVGTFGGSTKVWLGWLNPALLPLVDLETEGEVGHPFLFLTPKRFVDKFGLGCADAGGDRLSALEAQLVELKEGLQVLLSAHLNPGATGEGGSGFHSATDGPPPAPVPAPLPPKKTIEAPPGLRAFRSLVLLGSLLFGRLLNTQGWIQELLQKHYGPECPRNNDEPFESI